MAKDFDFIRRSTPKTTSLPTDQAATKTEPTPASSAVHPQAAEFFPPRKPAKKSSDRAKHLKSIVSWAVLLLIIGVASTLTYLYYESQKPVETSELVKPATETSTTELVVTIYNRGAGEAAAKTAKTSIETLGLSTTIGAESSLTYDKSYIFYKTGELENATKINSTLSGYAFELRESPLAGISVYLASN